MKFDAFHNEVVAMFPAGQWRFVKTPEGEHMHGAEHENGLCVLRGFGDFAIKWTIAPLEISCDTLSMATRFAWGMGGWRVRRRIREAMGIAKPFRKCKRCHWGQDGDGSDCKALGCDATGYVRREAGDGL